MNKKGIILIYFMLTFVLTNPSTLNNFETVPSLVTTTETEIIVYSPAYEWIYKLIDGKIYKRLYNTTIGEWASDWIAV